MKRRVTAVLLLVAIASMATAAPACASRAIETPPAVRGCAIDGVQPETMAVATAPVAHELIAILPAANAFDRREPASPALASDTGVVVPGRRPLLIALRI